MAKCEVGLQLEGGCTRAQSTCGHTLWITQMRPVSDACRVFIEGGTHKTLLRESTETVLMTHRKAGDIPFEKRVSE